MKVFEHRPEDFSSTVEVAACYVECDGKLLLLQIAPKRSEGETWGVPAGKIEKGESPLEGARRELFEETGIWAEVIESTGCLYMRKPEIDYVYHLFRVRLKNLPKVKLSAEHVGYRWVNEIDHLKLMAGAREALEKYREGL